MARSVRSTPTAHPTPAAACRSAGRDRQGARAPGRRTVRCRRCQRCPDICDTGRWRSQIAWITSGRPHDDRCSDTACTTSSTVSTSAGPDGGGRPARWRRRAGRRSSRPRRLRSATVSPDRRHRGRTCATRVSADASRSRAARSNRDGARPSRWRNSSSLAAMATPIAALRLENTIEQLVRDTGDLRLPGEDRSPLDPEAVGQLGTQHRLVQAAEHPLMPLQVAGIQGEPATLGGLHLGRDHGVGVDLRVVGPRCRLAERGHRQPLGVGVQPAAVGADPGRRPEPFQMLQRRRHSDIVGFEQPVVTGQRPPHRQRLRRRERGIEPRHRPHHPAVGRVPVEQLPTQRRPRNRVTARQQQLQRLDVDGARQAEPGRLTSRPLPRHLARSGREVLGVVLRRRPRRRRMQGSSPAASASGIFPPARGHLSACDRVVGTRSVRGGHGGSLGRQRKGWLRCPVQSSAGRTRSVVDCGDRGWCSRRVRRAGSAR